MGKTVRTVAIMILAPPLLLYALAQAGALATSSALVGYGLLLGVWAVGMAALATSGWSRDVKVGVAVAYTLTAILALPLLALVAVCTTGDCL